MAVAPHRTHFASEGLALVPVDSQTRIVVLSRERLDVPLGWNRDEALSFESTKDEARGILVRTRSLPKGGTPSEREIDEDVVGIRAVDVLVEIRELVREPWIDLDDVDCIALGVEEHLDVELRLPNAETAHQARRDVA